MVMLESDIERFSGGIKSSDSFFTSFLANRNITCLDRGVLTALVDVILVHEDKRITVKFKFANRFERVLEFIEENKAVAAGENNVTVASG